MNKYKLNVLRFMTRGEVSDEVLKKSFDHKVEGNKFTFKFKAGIVRADWKFVMGSAK